MGKKYNKTRKLNKWGRNEPCFCGSKKKYKKCCLLNGVKPNYEKFVQDANEHLKKTTSRLRYLESKGIYVRFPNTITFKGKSFLAVGNKLMYDNNPDATFHQLILRNLSMTLGKDWWEAETIKSSEEKHYIKRCFEELSGSEQRDDLQSTVENNNKRSMLATGNTQSLLSLAFDVYLITHKGYLPDEWLSRLKNHSEFQGVRYEIGVASIFVRMGCELEFYDPKELDGDGKRPKRAEFIATHTETGNKVAVEAKSRHVDGVIHQQGTLNYRKALKGDITNLYKKALLKKTDGLPLLVFIDVNSPSESDKTIEQSQWYLDVRRSFESRPTPTKANPDRHTALFVTNYSSHYQGNSISHSGQYLFVGSLYPIVPLSDGHNGLFMEKLLRAVGGYGYVPPSMDDQDLEIYETDEILSRDDFIEKLIKLTSPSTDDPEYARKSTESQELVDMLLWDAEQKCGGMWNNKIATECYQQFEWLYSQP